MSTHGFNRILIANRGAIAVRIIRTLRDMGIDSIVVYSEADRESLHVGLADHAYSLGEGPAASTYLDQDKIIAIAKESDAQAVHPGYGFLSENSDFVARCEREGIVFLGPNAAQIGAFGLKHKARELAEASGTPLLPGSGILNDAAEAVEIASKIGYPVMLKSTAGGGGIGMQLCRDNVQLLGAWDSVSTLSANNFSNSDLFIEKFVEHARHIEVQIFGDGRGGAVSFGERDCSAQRRNQKVLEETPAPNLSSKVRTTLHDSAVQLVSSTHYRSAGTVEFIVDADSEEFYFLEVNTRLQVEHGVTEEVYGVDIVRCMIELGGAELLDLTPLSQLIPKGHAIQARIYAEDPRKEFQPNAGLLSHVSFPDNQDGRVRVDTWIETGVEVSPFYDPMLAKVISMGADRTEAMERLKSTLAECDIYGIETNISYLRQLIDYQPFSEGRCLTASLANFTHSDARMEILVAGTMTSIQDMPGRIGYWDIGVPPSGPFDSLSFELGNRLLSNPKCASGLEMTLNGAHIRFTAQTEIVLSGATMQATLDELPVNFGQVIRIKAGQVLRLGKLNGTGSRSYLLIKGGVKCPKYLGSRSTFTLGQFGGHAGRALRVGDVLHFDDLDQTENSPFQIHAGDIALPKIFQHLCEQTGAVRQIRVIAGPQGAPDYFFQEYIDTFFDTAWKVHYNSSRTGVRLIGPKPIWTRENGGEAGLHPSNIHDNAYAIGTIDFTGDMPVILGPDGPSLGGFVCPATVITADLWMVGQLAAGDQVQFVPVSQDQAIAALEQQDKTLSDLSSSLNPQNDPTQLDISVAGTGESETVEGAIKGSGALAPTFEKKSLRKHFLHTFSVNKTIVTVRQSGDAYLLVEYGDQVLDIELRFKVHQLMLALQTERLDGVLELTPGIRSLQIHYDVRTLSMQALIKCVIACAQRVSEDPFASVPSRIVRLPISWDDEQCKLAVDKYHQSVRENAPWYPSNIEFIRRINGLDSIEKVKEIVFNARYLVMGLGDVYLGAPVATPINPAHRLVTTKYNPARTWTAENSVGIGGSYLCIYGMEGPGGYQFVGRTLQMWNRYRQTAEFSQPWLLRFFDQIQFYPVTGEELLQIRKDFPLGNYPLHIENTEFNLTEYKRQLTDNKDNIDAFTEQRQRAFDEELARWKNDGQFHFEEMSSDAEPSDYEIPNGMLGVDSPVSGSLWEHLVSPGDQVEAGQLVTVIESMKMEIQIHSPAGGRVHRHLVSKGDQVVAGNSVLVVDTNESQS